MSTLLNALRCFAAWWQEGLTNIGSQMVQAYGWPAAPIEAEGDADSDREAWEEERARLALSPWWM
jgi:hypothetical protein